MAPEMVEFACTVASSIILVEDESPGSSKQITRAGYQSTELFQLDRKAHQMNTACIDLDGRG